MSDINYLKLYQPNLNVAFAGTDKDEVLADKFQGDSNEFFRAQNRRRVELLSKHTQVVDRPKTLVELEQSGIDLENKERREQERDYGFSLLKYHEAVGEIYGEGESIEDLINRVFEESSSKDTLCQ